MTTVYLIRHAEAEGNLHRRIHGHYNALITENGFLQIKALEERFREIPVDGVWASDLYRTMTTARSIYEPKGLELHTDSQLREIHMGDWEDHPWGEIYYTQPEEMTRFNTCDPEWQAPNGEDLAQVGDRVLEAVTRIARQYPNQTVAIFTHGTAIRQVLANVMGLTPQQWNTLSHSENTAVSCLNYDGEKFQIQYHGDASHLSEDLTTLGKQMWWRKDGKARDVNLWFRPIQWPQEKELYVEARHEAWISVHGTEIPFDGDGFLADAQTHLSHTPWGVTVAMAEDQVAGILQLDPQRYQEDGAGYIPFFYIVPQRREQNLGIQLIGQAVAFYRKLGRDRLRLRCAPHNHRAQHFYQKYGFYKIGDETGSRVPLDILEKYIGYDR